jgi:hypothetical protein
VNSFPGRWRGAKKFAALCRRGKFIVLFLSGFQLSLTARLYPRRQITMSTVATISRPLYDRISDALTANPHVQSQNVRVEAADGRVVLKGNVSTFFQKQMAQEALRRVDGVQQIENLLQVNWA